MKKALVFGGTGWVGHNVALMLQEEGYDVTICARGKFQSFTGNVSSIKNIAADKDDEETVRKIFEDAVYDLIGGLFGNKYLILTTITMLIATIFAKPLETLSGGQEIGTYLIHLFFFAVGAPASIGAIFQHAPLLLLFCGMIVAVNMLFCFVFGKLLRFDLEECILASNACIGGPTTAAAMAISKGWIKLVGPVMLVGTLGYVVGNYLGAFTGNFLGM